MFFAIIKKPTKKIERVSHKKACDFNSLKTVLDKNLIRNGRKQQDYVTKGWVRSS